jgi:site-specific DNA recombinase
MAFSTHPDTQTRCAIYTRKSTTAGLEMEVNSLEMQREVCQAHIKCQAHRNWIELPRRYDDGGYSGGTLERPALKRLIADIEAGRIDIVVIYKIDRLSRSLMDFVRLIDVLDKYGVAFVSVTQTFDTSDSMGRLVLNILLTFSQFERELASEGLATREPLSGVGACSSVGRLRLDTC